MSDSVYNIFFNGTEGTKTTDAHETSEVLVSCSLLKFSIDFFHFTCTFKKIRFNPYPIPSTFFASKTSPDISRRTKLRKKKMELFNNTIHFCDLSIGWILKRDQKTTNDLFNLMFKSPQYPFWFYVQTLWSCYVVRKSCSKKKKSVFLFIKNFVLCFMMIFLQRELFGLFINVTTPLQKNFSIFYIYSFIFVVFFLIPFNFNSIILSLFFVFITFLYGFNQARIFTLVLRNAPRDFDPFQLLPLCIIFGILDQFFEFFFRPLLSGNDTKLSNEKTMFISIILFIFLLRFDDSSHSRFFLYLGYSLGLFNVYQFLYEFFKSLKRKK